MSAWLPRSAWCATLMIALAACSSGSGVVETTVVVSPSSAAEAAEVICPIMWAWVTAMGDAFNAASHEVANLPAGEPRRARWVQAFEEMEQLDTALADQVGAYRGEEFLAPLVAEIVDGVVLSQLELGDLRELLETTPEVDEGRHQDRTAQLIVRTEKVIDVVKPELAALDADGTLIPAFRTVPSCQHAVKDVDDGVPRDNG